MTKRWNTWARRFLHHRSAQIPPSSRLWNSCVRALFLTLFQFCIDLFVMGPGSRKTRGPDRPWEGRRVKRLVTSQHRSVGIRTKAGLWWSYDPEQQSQAISQENWWHCHLDGGFLHFCGHAHFLLNHWWSFVVHSLFYWLLLLLLLLIFILFLFDVWFSFVGRFSPPEVERLSSFPGILPPVYVATPIYLDEFALDLENHPSQPQLSFVLEGLSKGFWVAITICVTKNLLLGTSPSLMHIQISLMLISQTKSPLGQWSGPPIWSLDLHHTCLILSQTSWNG